MTEPEPIRLPGGMRLSQLFGGDEHAALRQQAIERGVISVRGGRKKLHVQLRATEDGDYEVLALAAVSRDPGRSEDYLDDIQDYKTTSKDRARLVEMYWKIYRNEGIVNNATNKIAAILSGGGAYKVRKAKRGKGRKATEQLQDVLHWWTRNVNAVALDAVVTGARGLKAVTQQGARQALVEGSYMGRTVWTNTEVPGVGRFDLPMNIQAITTGQIEPVKELKGMGVEAFYWKPPRAILQQLRTPPKDKQLKQMVERWLDKDMLKVLQKQEKVLLDPSLLLHVKHRGVDVEAFGESFIQPALSAIAYRRIIEHLDIVSMQNIINRLTIVKVGSADPASPYSKVDVAQARAALMQSFFDDPGPNMTIIWQGDDVSVEDVGAHTAVLSLDERHKISEAKIKMALGVADALLTGTTTDGKAAGWAAAMGTGSQLDELENSFASIWTTVGERIAVDNGFTDIDLIYEFDNGLITDRIEEMNQTRQDYIAGTLSLRSYLRSRGRDPDAEFRLRAEEQGLDPAAETTLWRDVFQPPQGLQGQGEGKVPGAGRTPDRDLGKPATPPAEEPGSEENK
jgi:hypothetical protein